MAKKPPVKVKVRKWVTCAEPGCKKRATVKSPFCGEHQNAVKRLNAARHKKRKADPKKSAAKLERQWLQEKEKARVRAETAVRKKIAAIPCLREGCNKRRSSSSPFCGPHAKEHKEAVEKATRKLKKSAAAAVKSLGKMNRAREAIFSPASRLIKAHCQKCDYTIRLSRKWIDVKRPMCPACLRSMVTELDGLIDADPRQLPLKKIKKGSGKGRADPAAAKQIAEAFKRGV